MKLLQVVGIPLLAVLGLLVIPGCGGAGEEERRSAAAVALDGLAADLAADPPEDAAAYAQRLRAYLEDHPSFFGSAAALIDRSGAVIASPYVYRGADGYVTTDLAVPGYNVETQEWFTAPLAANAGVWTDPYFDAGGGEVWMVTRSVPVHDSQGVFVVLTTDLVVEPP